MWKLLIRESNTCGKTHPDTITVNDLNNLKKRVPDNELPRIAAIEIYHDDHLVYGYEVTYAGGVEVGHHIAAQIHPEVKCDRFELNEGEHITAVEGRTGDLVDRLAIVTSEGRSFGGGGEGGGPQRPVIQALKPYVIAIGGGLGGHMHNFNC